MNSGRVLYLTLLVSGYAMIFGGFVRIMANRNLFEWMGMEGLWSAHPYFKYIYVILGAFVFFTGITFIVLSKNIAAHLQIIRVWTYGFIAIGALMAIFGIRSQIPLVFYMPDVIFCLLLGGILFYTTYNYRQS